MSAAARAEDRDAGNRLPALHVPTLGIARRCMGVGKRHDRRNRMSDETWVAAVRLAVEWGHPCCEDNWDKDNGVFSELHLRILRCQE